MGDFRRASGIVEDSEGTLFVADAGRSVVQVFNAHGHPVRTIAAPGTDHGQLWKPRGLGLTDDGRLFVLDSGNHRAQIFSKEGEWLVTFGTGRAYTRDSVRRKKEGAAP